MMPKKLTLEGANLVVSGTAFPPYSYVSAKRLSRELAARGATIKTSLDGEVDALIAGVSSKRKVSTARKRHVPVLEGDALSLFLSDGAILLPSEAPLERDTTPNSPTTFEPVGELRSLFSRHAEEATDHLDASVWANICELCDRTPAERQEEVCAYIEGMFFRGYEPKPADEEGVWCFFDAWWEQLSMAVEVSDARVMPPSWLLELVGEERSPRHLLAHVLMLDLRPGHEDQTAANLSQHKNIEGFRTSPELAHITTIHLRHGPKYEWLFGLLAQNPAAANIHTLHMHDLPGSHMHTKRIALPGLRELLVHADVGDSRLAAQGLGQMGRSSLGSTITSLSIINGEGFERVTDALAYEGCFPSLERMVIQRGSHLLLHPEALENAVFPHRLRSLRLEFIEPDKKIMRGWLELEGLRSLEELDLSACVDASGGTRSLNKKMRRALLSALGENQPMLLGLKRLIFGAPIDSGLEEAISTRYPTITIS